MRAEAGDGGGSSPRPQALRNRQVFRVGKRQSRIEHRGLRPVDEPLPHLADENQRHVVHVPHLQELPDHQHFEHGADAAGHDDERVGGDHEMMQACEERLVLERLLDERIHVLLEGQFDADADRSRRAGRFAPSLAACISPGPPPVTMSQPIAAKAAAARFTSS